MYFIKKLNNFSRKWIYFSLFVTLFHSYFFFMFPDSLNRTVFWFFYDGSIFLSTFYLYHFFTLAPTLPLDIYWFDLWYSHA